MVQQAVIKSMLLRQMLTSSNASIIASTLLALLLAYLQRGVIGQPVVLTWLAIVLILQLSRVYLANIYKNSPLDDASTINAKFRNFRLGVLITGVVWGISGLIFFPADDLQHQMFLIFMLAGLSVGGVVSYSADLVSAVGFATLVLLPITIRLFLSHNGLSEAMGLAATVYLSFILTTSRFFSRSFIHNITLQLEAITSEERYRLLLRHSPVGIFYYNTDLVITYCNDRFADILSTGIERIIGLDMKMLKDQSVLPVLRNTLKGEMPLYEGKYFATLSSVNGWISMSCAPSRDAGGKIIGGIAVLQDITERKMAEKALLTEIEKNEMLFRTAGDGLHIMDVNGKILQASDSFCRMLGYSQNELHEMNVFQWDILLSPDKPFKETINLLPEEGAIFETQQKCKDGHIIDVQIYTNVVSTQGERYVYASARDITESLRAKRALLRESEKNLALLRNASDGIHIFDYDANNIEVSDSFCTMLGYQREELIGMNVSGWDINHTHDQLMVAIRNQIAQKSRNQFETRHKRKDGTIIDVEITSFPLELDGKPVLFNSSRDITERKKIDTELRIAATAFESQEGIMVTDNNGVILRVNQVFTNLTGYTSQELIGQNPRILKSGQQDSDFYKAMWKCINNKGKWEGEIWDRRKNGEIFPTWLSISAVKDLSGEVTSFVSTHTDISERKVSEEKIRRLAFYDSLTGLPNRRLLMDRLGHAIDSNARSGKEAALLFIDLDNFKNLNDTLGHDIGDKLLQQVAKRLESSVRMGDTVARLGGDEFMVIIEDLSQESMEAAAQTEAIGDKILEALSQQYRLSSNEFHSTCSIGATLFKGRVQTSEDLFKQADIAMYQAKKAGRNALRFFDPQMQDAINARSSLEGDLRKAVEGNQFQLYYQVQVDSNRRPLGAEALIRWNHPERGMVSPAQFIPLAEESGLIVQIGKWVLEAACTQLKAWQQNPLYQALTLSVNVSAKQFHESNFVDQVHAAVELNAIDPALLKLEPTESMLQENIEDTISTMNALKAIGVRFSLDDFGTGFSSLQYLKKLPLNQLKIDQSFVRDLVFDSNDQAIVRTIILMAQSLALEIIAEGVETEEQLLILQNNGCDHFQGYLFGKPVPIEQFETQLVNSSKGYSGSASES
jgi:diguanylate cyclase (GGDEF)-like protein/PAS domain S-box-containing protein